jgi:hypothetical protein
MNTEELIQYVTEEVQKSGGTVQFPMERAVFLNGEETACNGYWDKDTMVLAAARKQDPDNFLRLLVHEYCHFRQWASWRRPYWVAYDHPMIEKCGYKDMEETFFKWVEGDEVEPSLVTLAGCICRDLELDCERLSVETIQRLQLSIDIDDYIRRAAAYVHFYNVLMQTRKWYEIGNEPYNNPVILEAMPDNLNGDFEGTPPEIVELMKEQCYT